MDECPCPACGFFTTGETFFGSYNICPICGWEDDHVQLANPGCAGGANSISLIEIQQQTIRQHPLEELSFGMFNRDPNWRPLLPHEIDKAIAECNKKYWANPAIDTYEQAYWVKNTKT